MKKIYVTRSSLPPLDEYMKEICDIWDSHWLTNEGKHHMQFEENLKKYLSIEKVSLFSSGHMALETAIEAMDLTGEIITTPFTFASTTHAIVRNGLEPVFCDINDHDYTMDVNKLEQLITERTTAIIPVHIFGNVCKIEKINEIAKKYHLKVIYDAAHTFGECYNGKAIVNYGDASIFSFHATKVMHTIEGGAVCHHDYEYGKRLNLLRNFGIQDEEIVRAVGANGKMNEFQAAMGICNLRHIDEEIKKRKNIVEYYDKRLNNIPGIRLNPKQADVKSNYAYYPILIEENQLGVSRNDIYEFLKKKHIYIRKYFYPLTSTFDCYLDKYDVNLTPIASNIAKRVLTLPLYADLAIEDARRICDELLACVK